MVPFLANWRILFYCLGIINSQQDMEIGLNLWLTSWTEYLPILLCVYWFLTNKNISLLVNYFTVMHFILFLTSPNLQWYIFWNNMGISTVASLISVPEYGSMHLNTPHSIHYQSCFRAISAEMNKVCNWASQARIQELKVELTVMLWLSRADTESVALTVTLTHSLWLWLFL